MKKIALQMDFATSTIEWLGKSMTFHPRNYFKDNATLRKVLSNEPYSVAEAYIQYVDAADKCHASRLAKEYKTPNSPSLNTRAKM